MRFLSIFVSVGAVVFYQYWKYQQKKGGSAPIAQAKPKNMNSIASATARTAAATGVKNTKAELDDLKEQLNSLGGGEKMQKLMEEMERMS